MSQQTLGEDRTTMVTVVDELEAGGLIERGRNPSDRRAYALELTKAGERWLERARPLLYSAEDGLLATLDPGEREQFLELLQRVLLDPPPPD